jgi:predicted short-subunit dehydrogenase-like oxidoreductase (DUF2520 family)
LRYRGAELLGFTAESLAGRARAENWLGGHAAADLALLVAAAPDLYMIAVPDRAVPEVAEQLGAALAAAGARTGGGAAPFVAHTSGATSVEALRPCEETGASTLVFHPLQTFVEPLTGSTRFSGAAIAVTPADAREDAPARTFGFALARALDAHPFFLPDGKRTLYHAAAAVACNYLVTLEYHAERLFTAAGIPADEALALFLPLVQATLDNITDQGTVTALTGPLSRGDVETIAGHLEALAADVPDLLPVYQILGLATLPLLEARGELGPETIAALATVLRIPATLQTPAEPTTQPHNRSA